MNAVPLKKRVNTGFVAETAAEVVVTQPRGAFMEPPRIPPGLELLDRMDKLEMVELVYCYEVFCPCAVSERQIDINNVAGQLCYVVGDKACRCGFSCCGCSSRDGVRVMDRNREREVIHAYRENSCCKVLCGKGSKTLYVDSPVGTRIGSIKYTNPCCQTAKFVVFDENEQAIQILKHPSCCKSKMIGWKRKWEMEMFSTSRTDYCNGVVRKMKPEFFGDIGFSPINFEVIFPVDSDPITKALLLTVPFFINELGLQ